jgi:hypothetical protein
MQLSMVQCFVTVLALRLWYQGWEDEHHLLSSCLLIPRRPQL